MKLSSFKKLKIPNTSGVYLFKEIRGKILYIGKATSLKNRIRSYFGTDIVDKRGLFIKKMVEEAKTITYKKTDSVLEALLLEAQLIRKHKPKYNTKERDDKSFNHIIITKENFPRVLLVRGKELFDPKKKKKFEIKYSFGPFPIGTQLMVALKIVRKIFPFRDSNCTPGQAKPCFNKQINLCPGVCTKEISNKEYAKQIDRIKLFLEGRKSSLVKKIGKEMREMAKSREYEKALVLKRQLFALSHIQDVALIKDENLKSYDGFRIEGYDVAHISGKHLVGVMTVVEKGKENKSQYRKFRIKSFEGINDTKALAEIIDRRLGHTEWQLPKLIVVDGGSAQINTTKKIMETVGVKIPIVGVLKDEHHKPKQIIGDKKYTKKHEAEILLVNSEAHRFALSYHKSLRNVLIR